MTKKYRLGIIGFAHMHINDVAAHFAKHPQVEFVACADTVPLRPELREGPYTRAWNVKFCTEHFGIPKVYADYKEMLAKEKLDIVICCSENAQHADIVEACAAKGVHVCVEKPMAGSYADSLRMVRACEAAGTKLVVNWPLAWWPQARLIKQMVDNGAIGKVLKVTWTSGHTGPLGPGAAHAGVDEESDAMSGVERGATWWHQAETGGGAMLDYCCYGAMASLWYIGENAVSAVGMKANLNSQWGDADDNGAMIVRFPSAMGVYQGSWTQAGHGVDGGPIIYGTRGILVMDYHSDKVKYECGGKEEWLTGEPLPAGRADIAEEMIHHLETGEPLHPTLEARYNLEAMAILDAGFRSAASGKQETVETPAWHN